MGDSGHRHDAVVERRRWIVLVVLCIGQLMIVLDSTVVNVALPSIQRELHFSQASLAWVVNAYLLTFGGLLLLAGRLGDLIGRARVFLVGLAAFSIASMLCGLAQSASVLVVARFVQGASAAMVASMVLGIITPMFPEPKERTTAFSVFAFVAIGGASLGLVLGGALTELLNWHWIFFINVPVGAAALLVGSRLLEKEAGLGVGAGADIAGAILVTAAPVLAVYGLINAGNRGWGSTVTIGSFIGAGILTAVFLTVERRVRTPLVPLRIFRYRGLMSATVVRLMFPMGGFGFNFLGALYLQHVLGYSPLRTGLAYLPGSAVTGFVSLAIIPRLVRRVGMKPLVVVGLLLISAGVLSFAPVPVHANFFRNILPAMILTGAGFGLVFMPSVSISMSDVGPSEAGVASGLANVAVQLGASIGVAALATVSTSRTRNLLDQHHTQFAALTGGYRIGMYAAAGFAATGFVLAIALLPSARRRPGGTALPEGAALAH